MSIAILDYGMGNLRSVLKAFERLGCDARIVTSSRGVDDARALVLPGVGAFPKCFQNLDAQGLISPILSSLRSGKPFLGICLGLQILFTASEEFGGSPGFNVIPGRVVRFQPPAASDAGPAAFKIPHMGWNTITVRHPSRCLDGIQDGSFFYFVHSYYVAPDNSAVISTTTDYGGIAFASSIVSDNLFACQFHPEKSQATGLRILKNFAAFAAAQ